MLVACSEATKRESARFTAALLLLIAAAHAAVDAEEHVEHHAHADYVHQHHYHAHANFHASKMLFRGESSSSAPAADAHDYLFKLLLIGDTGTGKSCLLHQFIEHRHKRGSSHTVGVEFGSKIVTVGGKRVKLQIWDTAGQERFRSVTRSYYRGAAGCLVVYDIASKETFERTANWVRDARTLASLDISTVLVGNKLDLRHDRAVSVVEASAFAQEHGLLFLEASALTGEGVEEAFLRCARAVLSKVDDGVIEPGQEGVQLGVGDGDGDGGGAGRRCSYC